MPEIGVQVDLPFTDEDLAEFLQRLRDAQYRIGTEQMVAVQLLLTRLAERGRLPENPRKLASFIGPIICKSAQQQADFLHLFDIWIGNIVRRSAPTPASSPSNTEASILANELAALRRAAFRFRTTLILFLLIFIGVSAYVLNTFPVIVRPPDAAASPALPLRSLLGITFGVLAAVFLFRLSTHRYLARKYRRNPPSLESFSLSSIPEETWLPPVSRDVAVKMRRRISFEDQELDIAETVNACSANAGIFTPVHLRRSWIPEYLILVDRAHLEDLGAVRASSIANHLRREGVFAEVFFFDQNPAVLVNQRNPLHQIPLTSLWTAYPSHRLITCGEARSFLNPLTGLVERWVSLLEPWENRSLLTPAPVADWAGGERAVAARGFQVLPLTADGFAATADLRLARRVLDDGALRQPPRYPDVLLEDLQVWIAENEPEAGLRDRALRDIRHYLGENGYGWFAACAVYPEVRAALTLYLGNQIASPYQALILERLARLPWMRLAIMPDWLRHSVLRDLGGKRERTIRGALRALLMDPSEKRGSFSFDIASGSLRDLARLWFRHCAGWKDQVGKGEPAADRVFMTWMDDRLALRVPRALIRWLKRRHRQTTVITSATLSPDTAHYFVPSYGFSWQTVLTGAWAIPLVVLLGSLYGSGLRWLPFVAFLIFLAGVLLAFGLSMALVQQGKIRGAWFGRMVGFLIAASFIYGKFHGSLSFVGPPYKPVAVWLGVCDLVHPSRLRYLIWFVESSIILAGCISAGSWQAIKPFCPVCMKWTEKRERLYGPFDDEPRTVRDMLLGLYTRFFILSTTAPDQVRATVAQLESCVCASTTLITVLSRIADRSSRGELIKKEEKVLIQRLYVPDTLARAVYDWVVATASIRPNLVPRAQAELRLVVDGLLAATAHADQTEEQIWVHGEIPLESVAEARKMARIPETVTLAGLAVKSWWFVVRHYSCFAFTEAGIYSYASAAKFTDYSEIDVSVLGDSAKAKIAVEKLGITFKQEAAIKALKEIKQRLSLRNS